MSETSFIASGWHRDEALGSLLQIFDWADKHARTSQHALAEARRTLEHALTEATRKLTEATRNLDNERAKSSRLEAEVFRLGADRDRMQNSLSWRVTKP